MQINLSKRELATVLAGLRLRQVDLSGVAGEVIRAEAGDLDGVATDDGDFDALGISEIDTLAERLNTQPADAPGDERKFTWSDMERFGLLVSKARTERLEAIIKPLVEGFSELGFDADEEVDGGDCVDHVAFYYPRLAALIASEP